MNGNTSVLRCEEMESRSLPSGFGLGGLFGWFQPSAAVQADLAKLKTDNQQLQSDLVALGPTLQQDAAAVKAAVQDAIQNDPAVQVANTALTHDRTALQTTLVADWQAVAAAVGNSSALTAAFARLQADATSGVQTLKADGTALANAIAANAGVQAAKARLQADSAPIAADKAAIQADLAQLRADL